MGSPSIKIGMNLESLALGAAAILFGPAILTTVAGIARSLLKSGIKGGVLVYDKSKEMLAEARESIEDIAAEAKAEVSGETKQKAG